MKMRFKQRPDSNYLYIYIKVNNTETFFSAEINISETIFLPKEQKTKDKFTNELIKNFRLKLMVYYMDNPRTTAQEIRDFVQGKPPLDFLRNHLENIEAKYRQKEIVYTTYITKKVYINYFLDFLRTKKIDYLRLNRIQVEHFFNFLKEKKNLKVSTIRNIFHELSGLYNTLVDNDTILKNPFTRFKLPKEAQNKVILTEQEVDLIFTINNQVAKLYQFQILTGLSYRDTQNFDSS